MVLFHVLGSTHLHELNLLSSAIHIIERLTRAGYVAYFAGGFVRDRLLNRKIADIDIATSATPEEIEKLFKRTHPIGRAFGVMLVRHGRHNFEIATFRGERNYDGRRPAEVYFTDAEEDARRRDFTVNGMFFDPLTQRVLDYVGGQHDLKLKTIRAIGDADARFAEDHLRLLRAVRLRNALEFEYEPKTEAAIGRHAASIVKISAERLRDELTRMLIDPHRTESMRDLDRLGLLEFVIPELTKLKGLAQPEQYHREGDAWTHTLGSTAALPARATLPVALATLLHDVGKAETSGQKPDGTITFHAHACVGARIADRILRRLKFDNETRAEVVWLIEQHMTLGDVPKMRRAKQHALLTHAWFPDLLKVCRADIRGSRPVDESLLRAVVKIWKEDVNAKLLPTPTPLLTSAELMRELKIPAGPLVGKLKQLLHEAQIENVVQTKKEALAFLKMYNK